MSNSKQAVRRRAVDEGELNQAVANLESYIKAQGNAMSEQELTLRIRKIKGIINKAPLVGDEQREEELEI